MASYGGQDDQRGAAMFTVREHTATWHDAARGRNVPVRVYSPEGFAGRAPVVVFSHGLGSSCDGYAYLGRHWAAAGFLVVHPTHIGSDADALRGPGGLPPRSLADFLADVQHWQDRPRDVLFVLDRLAEEPKLRDRADLDRVAAAGHSYGAFTALALAGLIIDLPGRPGVTFRDPRVRAAVVMSPQSQDKFGLRPDSWNRIDLPVLSLTGTKDREYGVGSAAPRRTSYDRTPGRDQFLVTIDGATHATFDDPHRLRIRVKPHDPAHHDYIRAVTAAFLDAYLRGSSAAQHWLLSGALERLSAGACRLEYKRVNLLP